MKNHEGCTRQFTILSQSHYAHASLTPEQIRQGEDEIVLGFYHPEGGTTGEFQINWERLAGKLTPQLHAWNDSWSALVNFKDVLQKLAELDGTDPSVATVVEILKGCGVRDATSRTRS